MKRINLTDGSNKWFDLERATKFSEDSHWNGNNMVSVATGSWTEHEALYRTASGWFILNSWSQWEGTRETWERISDQVAYDWLLKNGYPEEVPDPELEARDLDAAGGETPRRFIRIPDALWTKAQATGNASQLVRELLEKHFEHTPDREEGEA